MSFIPLSNKYKNYKSQVQILTYFHGGEHINYTLNSLDTYQLLFVSPTLYYLKICLPDFTHPLIIQNMQSCRSISIWGFTLFWLLGSRKTLILETFAILLKNVQSFPKPTSTWHWLFNRSLICLPLLYESIPKPERNI